jgi:hypothetical protein
VDEYSFSVDLLIIKFQRSYVPESRALVGLELPENAEKINGAGNSEFNT